MRSFGLLQTDILLACLEVYYQPCRCTKHARSTAVIKWHPSTESEETINEKCYNILHTSNRCLSVRWSALELHFF